MGVPVFLLQIVENDATGRHPVVSLPAGGPLEAELVEGCVTAILAKGVGFFRTEAQVEQAVRAGIYETIQALKTQTKFVV